MLKRWALISCLIGRTLCIYAQCPDPVTVSQQINRVRNTPKKDWISRYSELQDQYKNCHLAPDSNYARILFGLSYAYSLQEQFEKACQLTQRSIAINSSQRKNAKPSELSKYYNFLGFCFRELDQDDEAIDAYKKSIQVGVSINNNASIIGQSLTNLAYLYYNKGDYEQSLNSATLGYDYCAGTNDTLGMTDCLDSSVQSLLKLDQLFLAEKQIRKAIQLVIALPTALDERNSYKLTLARILFLKHQVNEGLRLYQDLIKNYQRQNATDKAARVYNDLGYQYFLVLKDYRKALYYFDLAYKQFNSPVEKVNTLGNIASVYAEQKKYPLALYFLQKSLTTFPIKFNRNEVNVNPNFNDIRTAPYKEKLLSILQTKAGTWLDYGKAVGNRQHLRAALSTYSTTDRLIDIMRWEHTGKQSKLYWREKTRGIYEGAIETCYQLADMEQAFRFMEKSRAVLLADKLNELGAHQQLSSEQTVQEQHFRQRISTQQDSLANFTPDNAKYTPLRLSLSASQDSLDRFLKKLETSNPAYYRYKYDNTTPKLSDLQRYLNEQKQSLVTYFVGDSALYVLAVTGHSATLRKQPVGQYNQALRQFAPMLTNAEGLRKTTDVNRFLTVSHDLYDQLLAPLKLPRGRVVVSPDGFFIPFDALSRSASQAQYALDEYAFSYIYSASLLLRKRESNRQSSDWGVRDFLGVAPVDFAPSLKQVMLPNSDAALQPIAKRFGSSLLLTHKAATRRAFLTQASNAHVIHLFTHAIADSSQQEPRLYFADSTLQLSDLESGALPDAQLVVLAACKTGIGANQRGEGIFSLARGFAALGVPSVLTTLWSVQNEATYQLTDLFYQYLDEDFSKDVALQRAKQDWIQTADGVGQLPTYWAGLIVVGDAEPLAQTHYVRWFMGVILLVMIGLGGWFIWHKRSRVGSRR